MAGLFSGPKNDPLRLARGTGITCPNGSALRLTITTMGGATNVTGAGRVLTTSGEISDFGITIVPSGSATPQTAAVAIPAGTLISASITTTSTTVRSSNLFASLDLVRDTSPTGPSLGGICSGYISAGSGPCYPGPVSEPRFLPSCPMGILQPTSPAAGANFAGLVVAMQIHAGWILRCTLATDANIAARLLRLRWTQGGLTYFQAESQTPQAALTTIGYTIGSFPTQYAATATDIYIPTATPGPGAAQSWEIVVDNIQAGDQLSNITLLSSQSMI